MTEPDKLPDDIAALLDAERGAPGAAPGARARVHERLMVSLTATVATGTAGAAGAAGAAKLSAMKLVVLGVVAVAAAGGGGVALMKARAPGVERAAAVTRVEAPAPRATETVAETEAETETETETVAAPRVQPRRRDTLAAEQALLDRALGELQRGDARAALAGVARHATLFPRGALVEEREVLAIRALARSGDLAAARERAARFRKRFPHSIQIAVVDALTEMPAGGQ